MGKQDDMQAKMKRWRLILGEDSTSQLESYSEEGIGLSKEQSLMDQALAAIYNNTGSFGEGSGRGAGKGPSNPQITKWLGDIRTLFDPEIVTII